jgi:Tol biopolymer transport system component
MLLDCGGRCRWLDDPAWSPDGKRIVYSRTIERADGWGIGTLETVDVATGRARVELGPWKRSFTAGARYSPDGRQVVFEKVHKTGRGPEADIDGVTLTVVRLFRPGHPLRSLTDPRLFAATADWSPEGRRIVYSALATPDDEVPDLFWIRPSGGASTRLTDVTLDGGFAAEPTWLPDGSAVLFSGLLEAGTGNPLLLMVEADGTGVGSAFGSETVYGRHPRVQPTP